MSPTMSDDAFTDRLSEYLDNEDMRATERAAIDAHVSGCAECRATLAELRAVAAIAGSLPDVPPSTDLWPGIAKRLPVESKVVAFPAPRRFSFTLPQLVAAGLALMVLSGGMAWIVRLGDSRVALPAVTAGNRPPVDAPAAEAPDEPLVRASFADTQFDAAVADLEKALAENRNRLDPETIRILEENLLSIDQAIEQSRKALRADPANVYLNTHFAASRNRKLALLRRASALALAHDSSGS
jgi:anti-sigma factor RsiW